MADPERKLPAGLGGAAMGSHSGPHTEIRPHDEGSLGSLRLGRNLMWRVLRVLGIAAAFLLLCAVNASIVWYYWNLWGPPGAMLKRDASRAPWTLASLPSDGLRREPNTNERHAALRVAEASSSATCL